MTVTLTIEQLETIYQAALEGQAAKLELIENIQKNLDSPWKSDEYDTADLRHLQSQHARTTIALDEVEKLMFFSSKGESKKTPEQGNFSAWEDMPGGF